MRGIPIIIIVIFTSGAFAQTTYQKSMSSRLNAEDYVWGAQSDQADDIFDKAKKIDLSVDLGIGSDCGRVNFAGTLKSTLKNMLDSKYFGDMGKDLIAGSPMLLACYFSPTWCSILKHSQLSANLLSQSRLSQCALIDKYTDSRTEDFYRQRQDCVRKEIQTKGGDIEQALQACNNTYSLDLKNWAGAKLSDTPTNQLLESSALWAGLVSPKARETLNLVKSFVGDTVVSKGVVSVNYGPTDMPRSPRTHLIALQEANYKSLCEEVMPKVDSGQSLDQAITPADMSKFKDEWGRPLLDRQSIESLASLPPRRRQVACRKLSDAIAATQFSRDLNRAVDTLNTLSENPNLPPNRQEELREKARSLQSATSITLELQRNQNDPLNGVLAQINSEGMRAQREYTRERVRQDTTTIQTSQSRAFFFDCSDGVMCN